MAIVKGIKLLHKRYTAAQWESNIAKLAFGEIGIATDTGEVRCNTSSQSDISYSAATPVSFPELIWNGASDGNYISGISYNADAVGNGEGIGHALTITKGKLPDVEVDFSGSGSYITGAAVDTNNKHKIIFTLGNVPTSTLKIISTTDTLVNESTESVSVVTRVENVKGSNGSSEGHDHEIKYYTATVPTMKFVEKIVEEVGVGVNPVGEGDFVKDITVQNDGRTINVTYGDLPEIPQGTGEVDYTSSLDSNSNAKIVASVKLEGHTLSGTVKEIVGSKTSTENGSVTVTSEAGKIVVGLDDSNYALKSELSMAMVFQGTLGAVGSGATINALPTATVDLIGDTYKVITAATYQGLECDVGDLVVCSKKPEWVRIPAGEDADDYVNTVSAGLGIEVSTGVNPVVSHKDYSSASTVTSDFTTNEYGYEGKIITGIKVDGDGLGHIVDTPNYTTVNLVSESGARTIAEELEVVTTAEGGSNNKITVVDSLKDDSTTNDHHYVITHAGSTATQASATGAIASDRKINVVTSVATDSTGHTTTVTTSEFVLPEDTNTWRPIEIDGENTDLILSSSDNTTLKLNTEAVDDIKGVTLNVNSGTKQVTIKSLGKATTTNFGFVKLGTNNTLSAGDRTYGVGVNGSNQLMVNVPWTDTDQWDPVENDGKVGHTIVTADESLRFAAVKRDRGGHIIGMDDIYTIDGNAYDDTPPDVTDITGVTD